MGALRASARSDAAVAAERITLDCTSTGAPDALSCALRVEWALTNATDDATTAALVFSWPDDSTPTVSVADAILPEAPTLRPVQVLVPPHGTVTVALEATLELDTPYLGVESGIPNPLTAVDPLHARHPLLSSAWESAVRGFAWTRPDDLRFASVGPTTVRARVPSTWHEGGALRAAESTPGHRQLTYDPPAREPPGRIGIAFGRGERGELLRQGGPFVALGASLNVGRPSFEEGFRARAGYTFGLHEFVLVSLSAESDFRSQVLVTPTVELASWGMIVVPSLSLGVGLPIQLAPTPRPGVRFEASATLYSVGFVASLDLWPDDGTTQLMLLGRIGL